MPAERRDARVRQTGATPVTTAAPARRRTGASIAIVAVLVAIVAIVLARKPPPTTTSQLSAPAAARAAQASHEPAPAARGIPRLVDIGADKCIPCKAMAPILVELRTEYAGRMQVDFVDVWKDPAAGDPYRISLIPTQVFFDADGRELHRHEGFIGKADILATWRRLGYDFTRTAAPAN